VSVHPTAIVDAGAEIGTDVEIGPGCVVGSGVRVGDRCRIGPTAHLVGPMELGEECVVEFGAALGHDPQIKDGKGPYGGLVIGPRNVFREQVTVHRSMYPDKRTVIGADCLFMVASHIAHDCQVGNHVVMVNGAAAAGHVDIGDRVMFGGGAMCHQFSRIGELAMVAGHASLALDVAPFSMVSGDRPRSIHGLNVVGLRRAGFSPAARLALKAAFRTLFRGEGTIPQRVALVEATTPEVKRLLEFIAGSERGVTGLLGE